MLIGMANKTSSKYGCKCVDCSKHNQVKRAKVCTLTKSKHPHLAMLELMLALCHVYFVVIACVLILIKCVWVCLEGEVRLPSP